jgi:prolyl oligopeptidase
MDARLMLGALLSIAMAFASDDLPPVPATPKKPVVDDHQGQKIVDEYRWLENSADKEVREWSRAQNARSRAYLDAQPSRVKLVEQLKALYSTHATRFSSLRSAGGVLFAIESQPPKLQSFLVTLGSVNDAASARAIVDPNTIDPSGNTAVDFYVPSHDGKFVAVSLSKNGTEDGSVTVFEVATGKAMSEAIPRVNGATAGGSVAWNADSTGFWYTRYPRVGERTGPDINFYQQVYFHKLNSAQPDEYSLGKELPRIAEIALQSSDDGKFVLARVANGDGGDFMNYIRSASTSSNGGGDPR